MKQCKENEMKKFLKAIKNLGLKFTLKQIRAKKDKILDGINKKMDLPLLNESEERELLEGIWDLFDEMLIEVEDESK